MMRYLILLFCIGFFLESNAQVLPEERSVDWTLAGLKHDLPEAVVNVNFVSEGGIGDGVFSNNAVMESILASHDGGMLQINFPSGTYFFDQGIILPSNIMLSGAGSDSTMLLFDLGGIHQHLIYSSGSMAPTAYPVTANLDKGDSFLNLMHLDSFEIGDWIRIIDNDEELVTSDWAVGTTGQIVQIRAITDEGLELDSPLRRDYALSNEPRVFLLEMKENIGIEHLKIKRQDGTVTQTHNIFFRYANNCLVKCIKSELTNYAHVRIEFSSNCEVSGSSFREGHGYGVGGRAYGVVCHLTTGECLIQDNNFEHLRHAMLLQGGANGNVYAYNYSTDPFWEDPDFPSNSGGDLVLHGNYVYANLFEGNTVQNIVVDHSHGINGPYNTFFRNRAELYGIFMNNAPASNSQNFIGNEITNFGLILGLYALYGEDHFTYGNNHKGDCKPTDTEEILENSMYLSSVPFYYESYSSWPPIGYPNVLDDYHIEVQNNVELGYDVQCQNTYFDLNVSNAEEPVYSIYPNPATNTLFIESNTQNAITKIQLFDNAGRLVLEKNNTSAVGIQIEVSNLEAGMYGLRINDQLMKRIVILN